MIRLPSLARFLRDERGQSMVEYGITLGGIAAVSYLAVVVLGDKNADLYSWMANHLPGGEAGETGQVRIGHHDGLVAVNQVDGEAVFSAHGAEASENYYLGATLGSASYYDADEGWAGHHDH